MRRNAMLALAVFSVSLLAIGCNQQPDPKANPNFNEAAGPNPGAVKMDPVMPVNPPADNP
jgi:hypothetical protein